MSEKKPVGMYSEMELRELLSNLAKELREQREKLEEKKLLEDRQKLNGGKKL